ncbi:ankyrin repeat domain-containing protein [Chiayiivirga flava]|uniref:ankyrin repeat domain-containing protein n=1 Tax=Chiayiivirga flava TaxID=659595 RepID=UPI00161EF4C8
MKSLAQVLAEVERADLAGAGPMNSVHSVVSAFGETPLHVVSIWGDAEAIEVLVASGAEIDKPGEDGFTPLHCAAEQDQELAVGTLLRLGARNQRCNNGHTARELAEFLNHQRVVALLVAHGF